MLFIFSLCKGEIQLDSKQNWISTPLKQKQSYIFKQNKNKNKNHMLLEGQIHLPLMRNEYYAKADNSL